MAKDLDALRDNAERAAAYLKTLANRHRLVILCILTQGERSVGALEAMLQIRQPTLSQQLAILREQGLVETRRDGKQIHYSLASPETEQVVGLLYELFCAEAPAAAGAAGPAARKAEVARAGRGGAGKGAGATAPAPCFPAIGYRPPTRILP